MSKKTNRIKAPALDVPETDDDLGKMIADLGAAQRRRAEIEAAMNEEIEAVKARHASSADENAGVIVTLTRSIQAYCETHRARLTKDGKTKTKRFLSGAVAWRNRPPKVTLRGVDDILTKLKALKLTRFIRTKEEVDKEAMRKEPKIASGVAGVKIGSAGEEFVITPSDTKLDEVAA